MNDMKKVITYVGGEPVIKLEKVGDTPGHEFRGNQYAPARMSEAANQASKTAKTKSDHARAAQLHLKAATAARKEQAREAAARNLSLKAHWQKVATEHDVAAAKHYEQAK